MEEQIARSGEDSGGLLSVEELRCWSRHWRVRLTAGKAADVDKVAAKKKKEKSPPKAISQWKDGPLGNAWREGGDGEQSQEEGRGVGDCQADQSLP